MYFYPRSPCGERRPVRPAVPGWNPISIHALLAESDGLFMLYDTSALIFLSTLSLRRATLRVLDGSKSSIISIHALLAESDRLSRHLVGVYSYFYPRSPCGERLDKSKKLKMEKYFYPRSPCGERRLTAL